MLGADDRAPSGLEKFMDQLTLEVRGARDYAFRGVVRTGKFTTMSYPIREIIFPPTSAVNSKVWVVY
jgi:hypothetical protein